jgi:hypothetical protein
MEEMENGEMKTQKSNLKNRLILAVILGAILVPVWAQEKPAAAPVPPGLLPPGQQANSVYRLQINVNELEAGKVTNSRSYQMVLEDGGNGTIRVTRDIPVTTGPATQYRSVGLTLSCKLQERKDYLFLAVRFGLNDLVAPETNPTEALRASPVIRSFDSDVSSALKAGVPTVITAMDNLVGKGRYELEVTATRLH